MILMEVVVMMTLTIMMTIMVMMDFASIHDLEIRDFVLIVNSENLIQKYGHKDFNKIL